MMPPTKLNFGPKPLCEIVPCNTLTERLLKLEGSLEGAEEDAMLQNVGRHYSDSHQHQLPVSHHLPGRFRSPITLSRPSITLQDGKASIPLKQLTKLEALERSENSLSNESSNISNTYISTEIF
ncbi:hypothetical protein PGT21_023031 [Puccinia graminis f. sp. tritici]|uniref:Uncharacterized protein n=1 Tax=Puccinia graminis f. sp. tritici TaxID=56615 RepID=A0A5B0QW70_PUCGR|nr:hypothetical protein PGT21_023031 [Puccinia graminis f. sp. tritici]KAA1117153.1 hypothetical protein PGTUg99_036457 [Puccinia graminis f. sp. tritici]